MTEHSVEKHDLNRDPLSGTPGAHPVGTGVGAAGGGITGAAIGSLVAGPVGAVVGAAIGGVAGGLAGKGAAEVVNPTVEETYWRGEYLNRPYVHRGTPYDEYATAYRYGWESRSRHDGKRFDDVESDLEQGWATAKGKSSLAWANAREATRDAWNRAERAVFGASNNDIPKA